MAKTKVLSRILAAFVVGLPSGIGATDASNRPIGYLAIDISPRVVKCILERQPDLPGKWFSLLSGSIAEQRLLAKREVDFKVCYNVNMTHLIDYQPSYDYPALRAGLIRYLVQRSDLSLVPPKGLDQSTWYSNEPNREFGSAIQASIFSNELGFCLAKQDWSSVRAFVASFTPDLETHPYSGGARRLAATGAVASNVALQRITPMIAGCVPVGTKLSLDRERLRVILEETVFHAAEIAFEPRISSATAETN